MQLQEFLDCLSKGKMEDGIDEGEDLQAHPVYTTFSSRTFGGFEDSADSRMGIDVDSHLAYHSLMSIRQN